MKLKSKSLTIAIAVLLCVALICIFATSKLWTTNAVAAVRDVPIEQGAMDYQSILDSFENSTITKNGDTTYFEGFKLLDSKALSTLDYISDKDLVAIPEDTKVKYNFSYNKETNIVTIAAAVVLPDGTVEIDEISGVGFINEKGAIDAVMNVEGESVLLSEMQDAGMIENCGWFSKLIKNVVKVVVKAATVVAVAAVVAATVVVTAGAAAPALVAVGVGVAGSTAVAAGAAIAGVAAGAIVYATVGRAALQAGTAIAEALGNGIETVIDKTTGMLYEIIYKGVSYASKVLTTAVINKLAKNAYFMALANSKTGEMYYCTNPVEKATAISIVNANTSVSIYTYYPNNARSVAQQAGNNKSPVFDLHHDYGYFDHYHRGDIPHENAYAHVFFGFPQYN